MKFYRRIPICTNWFFKRMNVVLVLLDLQLLAISLSPPFLIHKLNGKVIRVEPSSVQILSRVPGWSTSARVQNNNVWQRCHLYFLHFGVEIFSLWNNSDSGFFFTLMFFLSQQNLNVESVMNTPMCTICLWIYQWKSRKPLGSFHLDTTYSKMTWSSSLGF